MSRNKNIGGVGLSTGLRLVPSQKGQTRYFDIDRNEAGLLEATMRFVTKNPGYAPPRTTPCDQFVSSSAVTTALLALLPYLASHTQKVLYNGAGLGIHYIDVLCRGAILDFSISAAPVQAIALSSQGSGYTVRPEVNFSGGGPVSEAAAEARLILHSATIAAAGTGYAPGDVITVSGGTYSTQAKFNVTSVGGGGAVTGVSSAGYGNYSAVPANNAATTGGTGSGLILTINWCVGFIQLNSGGDYSGTPHASLVGGTFTQSASIASVTMGPRSIVANGNQFTKPFDPVTTVLDTVELQVTAPAVPTGGTVTLNARVATLSLPSYTHYAPGIYLPEDTLASNGYGPFPQIDGATLNVGDYLLLNDGTAFGGLYQLRQIGNQPFVNPGPPPFNVAGKPWLLTRVPEMDEASEVSSTVYVQASEGLTNAGLWQCTVPAVFMLDTTPLTFAKVDAASLTSTSITGYKVTLVYHAIELNFEYVAADFTSRPRFIQDEYQRDDNGEIILDPTNPSKTMELLIDSVVAIQQVTTFDASGNSIGVSDGATVAIDEATWRAAAKYVGTAAQFEQTPTGAKYSVQETTTIKIAQIDPLV